METVEAGVTAFEVEKVSSVATLSPTPVAVVVLVAPSLDVPPSTAVDYVRRVHGQTPVVVVADTVPEVKADAIVPVDADAVTQAVTDLAEEASVDRTRRRLQRLTTLQTELGDESIELVCEQIAEQVGYDTVWIVQREDSALVPVASAGVPLSALRTSDLNSETPWAEAFRRGEPYITADESYTVAIPFADRCLVCTAMSPVSDTEVAALADVISSVLTSTETVEQPQYALLGDAVAHEVNNQLDIAKVHLELLETDGEHFDHVSAALERIGDVIGEVKALVSPQLVVEDVSLKLISEEVWSGVSTGSATLTAKDGRVEADERLLRLLLSNLFRNAVEHGGDEVTVKVGPLNPGGFYVADDGDGFTDAAADQLFEWGWSEEGGTGIGLALVSLVADRHGWEIKPSGANGARFEFRPAN